MLAECLSFPDEIDDGESSKCLSISNCLEDSVRESYMAPKNDPWKGNHSSTHNSEKIMNALRVTNNFFKQTY